jgi:hypothetical protein
VAEVVAEVVVVVVVVVEEEEEGKAMRRCPCLCLLPLSPRL